MAASRRLDEADPAEARRLLAACCGSTRWVERMLARRPFGSDTALLDAAREVWWSLAPADWRDAFAHHPQLGDRTALRARFPATAHLSEQEQAGVRGAPDEVIEALAESNAAYERRFGYIFIMRAAGRTAEEVLAALRRRLGNDPETEIGIAAEQQAEITALRLSAL